jgi:hypothetical protein
MTTASAAWRGLQPSSAFARVASATSGGGSPSRRGPNWQALPRTVTRCAAWIAARLA